MCSRSTLGNKKSGQQKKWASKRQSNAATRLAQELVEETVTFRTECETFHLTSESVLIHPAAQYQRANRTASAIWLARPPSGGVTHLTYEILR
ncbi:hypothetical protein OAF34_01260 [Pirellulaceae bacterium]|nr:hypothetical protein [Pirellulaceae bacterium]